MKNKYSLLIITMIPVQIRDGDYYSLDLWCKDISENISYVKKMMILCPISSGIKQTVEKIPVNVSITIVNTVICFKKIKTQVREYDVVQIQGGKPLWKSFNEIVALYYAKKYGKKIILSISSNRVKLTRLNAEGASYLKRLKAKIIANSIFYTQRFLSRYVDGVLLIGNALRKELKIENKNIHEGLASWINDEDILSEELILNQLVERQSILVPRLCICTRLEKMKGVHIAIEALSILKNEKQLQPMLAIYGHGEEREALESLADELGVMDQIEFKGYVSYGKEFFEAIQQYDLMLMTNLSDEQPRLVFDALSQGLIPISPNTSVYKKIGFDDTLLYKQGSALDLAKNILQYTDKVLFIEELCNVRKLLGQATIGQMHFHRNQWIQNLL